MRGWWWLLDFQLPLTFGYSLLDSSGFPMDFSFIYMTIQHNFEDNIFIITIYLVTKVIFKIKTNCLILE
jgi:hypothetical protein